MAAVFAASLRMPPASRVWTHMLRLWMRLRMLLRRHMLLRMLHRHVLLLWSLMLLCMTRYSRMRLAHRSRTWLIGRLHRMRLIRCHRMLSGGWPDRLSSTCHGRRSPMPLRIKSMSIHCIHCRCRRTPVVHRGKLIPVPARCLLVR